MLLITTKLIVFAFLQPKQTMHIIFRHYIKILERKRMDEAVDDSVGTKVLHTSSVPAFYSVAGTLRYNYPSLPLLAERRGWESFC